MRPVLACVVFLFAGCSFLTGDSLEKTVEKINRKCPAVLDSDTRIDSVSLRGDDLLRYHYTLLRASKDAFDSTQFRIAVWPGLVSQVRISSDMKAVRERTMTIEYWYSDVAGHILSLIRISPADYDAGDRNQ